MQSFEEKEKEMIETQRMVASKLETVESRAANAQQKLEATQVRFKIDWLAIVH